MFGWRAVLKFKHVPEQLFDLVMTPIMFTLLFTFVFGGALAGSPRDYLQIFLPGILVQTVVFNSVYSGMGLSTDLGKGLFDRFRSLPIWSLAPFAGLMVGDVLRHLIAGGIILTIGLILGYRPEAGFLGVLACLCDAAHDRLRHGLDLHRARPADPHADDGDDASASRSCFRWCSRPTSWSTRRRCRSWLRAFVEVNPVSLMTTAMRGLMAGTATFEQIAHALIAPVSITLLARARDDLAVPQAVNKVPGGESGEYSPLPTRHPPLSVAFRRDHRAARGQHGARGILDLERAFICQVGLRIIGHRDRRADFLRAQEYPGQVEALKDQGFQEGAAAGATPVPVTRAPCGVRKRRSALTGGAPRGEGNESGEGPGEYDLASQAIDDAHAGFPDTVELRYGTKLADIVMGLKSGGTQKSEGAQCKAGCSF